MAGGSGNGLYDHLYTRFFERRNTHEGYAFQQAPAGGDTACKSDVSSEASMVDLGPVAAAEENSCRTGPVTTRHSSNR